MPNQANSLVFQAFLKIIISNEGQSRTERHLNVINREFQAWYNFDRPHSARDFLPPGCESPPAPRDKIRLNDVVCETRLGGVLKSYRCRAA